MPPYADRYLEAWKQGDRETLWEVLDQAKADGYEDWAESVRFKLLDRGIVPGRRF